MPIKLNGATSGSVELDVPAAVGSDLQLTLPATAGTALVAPGSTSITVPSVNGTLDRLERAGNILQVKQDVKTDRSSVTGYNWTNTGLSVNITPTSTTSNILVLASVHLGGSAAYGMKLRLTRGHILFTPTVIGVGDGDGGRPAVTSVLNIYDDTALTATYRQAPAAISFLDTTVSTTSSITYKVQFAAYDSTVVYVNRSGLYNEDTGTTPHEFDGTPISTLTLMEVAA